MDQGQDEGYGDDSHSLEGAARGIEGILSGFGDEDEEKESPAADTPDAPEADEADDSVEASEESDAEDEPKSDDEEESKSEDEDQSQQTSEPRKHRVKVDGQELEVTEDELKAGYSRTQDYTRKTQALSEEKKQFSGERESVRAERRELATKLTELSSAVQALTQEPDWDKLRNEDPALFAQAHAAWQVHKGRLDQIEQARKAAVEAAQQADAETLHERLTAERDRLLEAIPAWKDDAIRQRERTEVRDYAKTLGYSEEDLANVADHRAFVMLRKAMLFDKSQQAKTLAEQKAREKVKAAADATVVKPGSKGQQKTKVTEVTRRKQRLAKTGRVEDAAAGIELLI